MTSKEQQQHSEKLLNMCENFTKNKNLKATTVDEKNAVKINNAVKEIISPLNKHNEENLKKILGMGLDKLKNALTQYFCTYIAGNGEKYNEMLLCIKAQLRKYLALSVSSNMKERALVVMEYVDAFNKNHLQPSQAKQLQHIYVNSFISSMALKLSVSIGKDNPKDTEKFIDNLINIFGADKKKTFLKMFFDLFPSVIVAQLEYLKKNNTSENQKNIKSTEFALVVAIISKAESILEIKEETEKLRQVNKLLLVVNLFYSIVKEDTFNKFIKNNRYLCDEVKKVNDYLSHKRTSPLVNEICTLINNAHSLNEEKDEIKKKTDLDDEVENIKKKMKEKGELNRDEQEVGEKVETDDIKPSPITEKKSKEINDGNTIITNDNNFENSSLNEKEIFVSQENNILQENMENSKNESNQNSLQSKSEDENSESTEEIEENNKSNSMINNICNFFSHCCKSGKNRHKTINVDKNSKKIKEYELVVEQNQSMLEQKLSELK